MYGLLLAVHIPITFWVVFLNGPANVLLVEGLAVGAVVLVVTVLGVVGALRSPVRAAPPTTAAT